MVKRFFEVLHLRTLFLGSACSFLSLETDTSQTVVFGDWCLDRCVAAQPIQSMIRPETWEYISIGVKSKVDMLCLELSKSS